MLSSSLRTGVLAAAIAAATVASVAAQQTPYDAAFVTRLGEDTIAVERFSRTPAEMNATVVLRSPRTRLRLYRMTLGPDGLPTSLESAIHDPLVGRGSPFTSRQTLHFGDDALHVQTEGGNEPGTTTVEGGRDVLPFIDMVHWPFELMLQRAHAAPEDSIVIQLLSGQRTMPFVLTRVGPRDYTIRHPFRGTMTATVDDEGRLLELDASGTTRALTVTRVDDADVEALARDFAARDESGRPLGQLSGRGEAVGTIGGATIAVDYGRPARRGRVIFGGLVDFGEVWRTGANRATQITTDRDLVIGGTPIPAGSYTLFSIPGPDTWTLIVNGRTDIAGTAYEQEHDVARIEMHTRELPEVVEEFTVHVDPEGDGGVLRLQWDRTEAYVQIEVAGG